MSENPIWYGFLDAGEKSTPVVMDRRLITGNPQTIYLYNFTRGDFVEYSRAVVEPKLRALRKDENSVLIDLKAGFSEARKSFKPRGAKPAKGEEVAASGTRSKAREEGAEEFDTAGADDAEASDWADDED